MRNSKLYSILSKFDKIEQNRFRKYLYSPYFNVNETLTKLFEVLSSEINGEKKLDFEKEKIWALLDLDREYDDVRFRKFCSDLLKITEDFLAQEIFQENNLLKASLQIQAIGKKKVEKLFNSTMRGARRLSDQFPHRSAFFHLQQYEIEKNYYEMAQQELQRTSKSNIEEISKHLDIFYIGEKLRWYCEVISRQHLKGHDYKLLFIEELIQQLENSEYQQEPSIAVYFQILKISRNPQNLADYFKLKDLLEKNGLIFPQSEALSLYYSAINYCIQKINEGNQKFLEELFDLYNDLIKKEIIFVDDELSPWDFRNIVVIALRLGKFKWTEHFINNYNVKIPESYRENAVSFNLANLHFYQKNYEKVIELLQTVEYEDFSYNLNSKAMLIATYYEIDEIEPLYSLLDSFRTYLNRNKATIQEFRRVSFLNLIKFTKKLTKILPGDTKAIQKFKEDLEKTKNVTSIGWLQEKISELE